LFSLKVSIIILLYQASGGISLIKLQLNGLALLSRVLDDIVLWL